MPDRTIRTYRYFAIGELVIQMLAYDLFLHITRKVLSTREKNSHKDGVERGSVDTFCVATIKINSEKKKLCFDSNGVNNRGGVTICAHMLLR